MLTALHIINNSLMVKNTYKMSAFSDTLIFYHLPNLRTCTCIHLHRFSTVCCRFELLLSRFRSTDENRSAATGDVAQEAGAGEGVAEGDDHASGSRQKWVAFRASRLRWCVLLLLFLLSYFLLCHFVYLYMYQQYYVKVLLLPRYLSVYFILC